MMRHTGRLDARDVVAGAGATDGTRPTVHYVPLDGEGAPPAVLADHDDLTVQSHERLDAGGEAALGPPACLLADARRHDSPSPGRLPEGDPTVPVLVWAPADTTPEWIEAGATDVIPAEAGPAVLTNRIEQYVDRGHAVERADRLHRGLAAMETGVLLADTAGQIRYANDAFLDLLPDDVAVRGRTLSQVWDCVDGADCRECRRAVMAGNAWEGEVEVSDSDPTQTLELVATPLDAEGGWCVATARDVTTRKAVQRRVVDAEERYEALIEAAPDAIVVADAETGRVVDVNEAAASLFERAEADLVGSHQTDLHPPEERERIEALFSTHGASGPEVAAAYESGESIHVLAASGRRIPVEINANRIDLGDRTLVQGHFRDVSERRQREQALAGILEGIPDIALVYNEYGEYEEVLTGSDDLLIDSVSALEGSDVYESLPPDVANRILDTIEATLASGEPQRIEYRLCIGDPDDYRWFEARTAPLQGDTYDDDCVIFLARDVTERKHRERDLRGFRQAVENAGHAIMITDTDGEIEYVNPAFEEVTGYAESEALGMRPSLLKSGRHGDEFYRDLWQTILAGEVWEGEIVNERKDGSRYHIDQTIAPITGDLGEIERFVAINTDITERKRKEQQLQRERDRLEEFAGTVAHDLRNPLSIALGHVDLAMQGDGDAAASLSRASEALERMDTMMDEVLTLSKQGQTVSEPQTVSLDAVVTQAWHYASVPDATLRRADDLSDVTLQADEPRLAELLENLFRNAVDHNGASVTLGVGCLPDAPGFYVEDDGSGIPPAERNRIFESGFTTATDGTGFGLSIVKQIVDAHGWTIDIAEGTDGGARFEIVTDPALAGATSE